MANITNLSQFLSDIADAIRAKKETTEQIPAENFDTEILSIETGADINNQDKEIIENGTYTADEGYTGLGTVTVNVPAAEDLQEQLNAQDTIIEELQTKLENKAQYTNNAKIENYTGGNIYKAITTVSELDTSNVTSMRYMFQSCSSLTTMPQLDTSSATDMNGMFSGCSSLTTIPQLDTSKVTSMEEMFYNCTSLTNIPLLDTSNVASMYGMLRSCTSLTEIPLLNTSKVTTMTSMFSGCTSLTDIQLLDTSSVTNMSSMFSGCTSLTTMPQLDTSSATDMNDMFYSCSKLTTVPELDTSSVTNMSSMFNRCGMLTTIPLLDTSNVTNMLYMVLYCGSLSDESLNNILAMCTNSVKITSSSAKTLKNIGLNSNQAAKCTTLPNYQAFLDAGWTTGY